jgi:hypothetical protein
VHPVVRPDFELLLAEIVTKHVSQQAIRSTFESRSFDDFFQSRIANFTIRKLLSSRQHRI